MSRLNELLYRMVMSKTGQKILGKRFRKFCALSGTPISQTLPEDVFLVGYPKSGTVWMTMLTAGVLYGPDLTLAPLPLIRQTVPDIMALTHYQRYRTPTVFRTHLLPQPHYRRVVHLVRDGRDVMVSLNHFNMHYREGRESAPMMDMLTSAKGLFPCRWETFIQTWHSNPHGAEILTLRYEDLLADPLTALQKYAAFLGVNRSAEQLTQVIENAKFEKLQKREKTGEMARSTWSPKGNFFRKGKAGSFKEEMKPEELALFQAQAGEALKLAGYALV